MLNMADLTVKKEDGTTNVAYVAQAPSAGDKTPAVWRVTAENPVAAYRTEYRLMAAWNGAKTGRKIEEHFSAPYPVVDTNGRVIAVKRYNRVVTHFVDQEIPDSYLRDKIAEGANLSASTLVKASVLAGYSPS